MRIQHSLKLLLIILTFSFSSLTLALTLDEAKTRGLLGEQPDGYLGFVSTSTSEVNALKNNINLQRQALYENIAKKNGTEINAVQQLAGKKAIEKASKGEYVKLPNAQWQKVE